MVVLMAQEVIMRPRERDRCYTAAGFFDPKAALYSAIVETARQLPMDQGDLQHIPQSTCMPGRAQPMLERSMVRPASPDNAMGPSRVAEIVAEAQRV